MAFAFLIAAHAGLWVLAISLQRRLPAESRAASVASAMVIHAIVASLVTVGLGICGALTPVVLTIAGVAAGALGLLLGGTEALRQAVRGAAALVRDLSAESSGVAPLLGLLALLLVVRHVANAWLFPPCTVDENAYHLPRLIVWVQTGNVFRPEMIDTRGYFPAGMQLLQAWWVVIPHHDVLVEGAALEMAALGAVATAALARSLGATRCGGMLAALLWACAPIVLVQGCSALNDAAAGALVLAAAAPLVRPANVRRGLFCAGLAVALGAGLKPTVLFATPGLVVLALLAWRRSRCETPAEPAPAPAWCRRTAIGAGLGAVFLGLLWYALNARDFGNPFYPIVPSVSGGSQNFGPAAATMTGGPSLAKMWASVKGIFGPRYLNFSSLTTPVARDQTGWGFALTLVGPLALAWMACRDRRWLGPVAAFAVAILATLLLVEHDPFNARFILWAAALPAAALGTTAARLPRGWVAVALLVFAGSADMVRTSVPTVLRDDRFRAEFLSLPWEQRDARQVVLVRLVSFPGDSQEALRWQSRYDEDSPVLCLSAGWPVAALARGDFRRRLEFASPQNATSLVETLRDRECRRVFAWYPPLVTKDAIEQAVASGNLRRMHIAWYEWTGP